MKDLIKYYMLDESHNPVATDMLTWGEWFENHKNRVVAQDYPRPDVLVSTVFLGLDHRFIGDGPPILFETMVYRHGEWDEQERYATWEEAELGHLAMLKKVMEEEE